MLPPTVSGPSFSGPALPARPARFVPYGCAGKALTSPHRGPRIAPIMEEGHTGAAARQDGTDPIEPGIPGDRTAPAWLGGFRLPFFSRIFAAWYVVAVSCYVLVIFPFLDFPYDVVSLPDQLIGNSFLVSGLFCATVLWAAALTGLARAFCGLKPSLAGQKIVLRISASLTLPLFVAVLGVFVWQGAQGGTRNYPDRYLGELDLLLANRFLGGALAVAMVVLYFVLGTRHAGRIWSAVARMRQLGLLLAACTLPLVALFLVQTVRLSLPARSPRAARPPAAAPSVIVIVLDSLPLGKTSLVPGWSDDLTPRLRQFAEHSVLFTRAYAPANLTSPSVATLLTGKYPANHGVAILPMALRGSARTENIAAELRRHGFVSGASVGNFAANPRHQQLAGFDRVYPMRGRGRYAWLCSVAVRFAGYHVSRLWSFDAESWFNTRFVEHSPERPWPAETNFSDGLAFLSGAERPRFLYVHVMAPHAPYLAEPPYRYQRLPDRGVLDTRDSYTGVIYRSYPESDRERIAMIERRFEESVLSADHQLGSFLEHLEAAGRFEDSIIVVLSDHGEMFEPSWVGHAGPYLDDSQVNVPLVVHLPGQRRQQVVDAPIGLVDVAPTLLDLVGIPTPPWMDGVSWKPVFSGGAPPDRPVYSYTGEGLVSLMRGSADEGSCRTTGRHSWELLSLETREFAVAEPAGDRVLTLEDPREFEQAVRSCYPWAGRGAVRPLAIAP